MKALDINLGVTHLVLHFMPLHSGNTGVGGVGSGGRRFRLANSTNVPSMIINSNFSCLMYIFL